MSVQIRILSTQAADFDREFQAVLHWSETHRPGHRGPRDRDPGRRVHPGDEAVLASPSALTRWTRGRSELSCRRPTAGALASLPAVQREALRLPPARADHHERQLQGGVLASYRDEDGTLLGQKVTPLDRVGIYVPGGKAAYPPAC